jgi:hypothetical protein
MTEELGIPHLGRVEITALVHRLPQRDDAGPVGIKIEALAAFGAKHFASFVALVGHDAIDGHYPHTALGASDARAMNARLFLNHREIIVSGGE